MAADLALTLQSDPSAPGVARAAVRRYIGGDVSATRLGELHLVISELVTNALLHGRGEIVVRLQRDGETVRGEVIDQGAGFEHEIRERGPAELTGRGLNLVDALTSRWGIHEGTTHVWFEIDGDTAASGPPNPRVGEDERPEMLDHHDGR
jgi:anti-sigma regulatory factor (Ser/Thr protein kinase)